MPTVPGSDGLIKDEEEALFYADKVRFFNHPITARMMQASGVLQLSHANATYRSFQSGMFSHSDTLCY